VSARRARERRGLRVLGVLRWAGIGVIALLLVLPLVPSWLGGRLLVVDGGSMAPSYLRGDVLLIAAPTGDDLVLGAPVLVGDDDARYVHRVVEVDGEGGRARLRGDANATADPGWVTQDQVSGFIAGHVNGAPAVLLVAATSLPGRIALGLLLLLLLAVPALRGAWRAVGGAEAAAASEAPLAVERAVAR